MKILLEIDVEPDECVEAAVCRSFSHLFQEPALARGAEEPAAVRTRPKLVEVSKAEPPRPEESPSDEELFSLTKRVIDKPGSGLSHIQSLLSRMGVPRISLLEPGKRLEFAVALRQELGE